ncbi:hypothetical protein ACSAZL_14065 [Methanosarcina sp. T3]|uniref:hypothetical protein n=1 Tax=Methanosarcina sp. T3 TaxID=3439062 RepID=UPI003F857B26
MNFLKKQIIVEYDEKKAELKKVKAAIREAGYESLQLSCNLYISSVSKTNYIERHKF